MPMTVHGSTTRPSVSSPAPSASPGHGPSSCRREDSARVTSVALEKQQVADRSARETDELLDELMRA